jgi:hypothetical protein
MRDVREGKCKLGGGVERASIAQVLSHALPKKIRSGYLHRENHHWDDTSFSMLVTLLFFRGGSPFLDASTLASRKTSPIS